MTFQVTGRPLISFGKHSGLLLMGLRYGRGDVAPARCPHPLPTSPEIRALRVVFQGAGNRTPLVESWRVGHALVPAVALRLKAKGEGVAPTLHTDHSYL